MDALALLLVLSATQEPSDRFQSQVAEHWFEAGGLKLQLAEPESPAPALLTREALPSVPAQAEPEPKPEHASAPPEETALRQPTTKASDGVQAAVVLVGMAAGLAAGFAVGMAIHSAMIALSPSSESQSEAGGLLGMAVGVPVGFVVYGLGGAIIAGIVKAATGEEASLLW